MDKMVSLRTKTIRAILITSLILILLGSVTGLALYSFATLQSYKKESRHLIDYTLSLQNKAYLEKLFRETRKVYSNIPKEVQKDAFSDEFTDYCLPLVDDDFYKARGILVKCREETKQKNISYMFTDPNNSAIVFVVDGDEVDWAYLPGQWIEGNLEDIARVSKSSWHLHITHGDEYGWVGTDYAPIYDRKGRQIGYAVMDMDLDDFVASILQFFPVMLPLAVVLVLLLAVLASHLLRKHIISYLSSMTAAAYAYTARDKVSQPDDAPFVFEELDIHTSDELEALWRSMQEMETDVRDTLIRLRTITSEQERLVAELSIAAQIQEGMLPKDFPAFPERKEFDIYASMTPAREVGGDLYDFFLVDEDHLAMVIADVSGKGVSAALFMVIAKTLIQNQTQSGDQDPADVFTHVNARLMEINKARLFVTAWMGILTISTGEMVYVNAGHEYPAVRRDGGLFTIEKDVHGVPLAARKNTKFKSGVFTMHPGDIYYQYTDGVTEANDLDGNLFGKAGLLEALNQDPDLDPQALGAQVYQALAAFQQDAAQFDDLTMMCLKYNGPGEDRECGT